MNMLTCNEAIWITLLVEYNVDNWSCRYSVGIVVSRSGGNIGLWNRLYWRGSYKYLVMRPYLVVATVWEITYNSDVLLEFNLI